MTGVRKFIKNEHGFKIKMRPTLRRIFGTQFYGAKGWCYQRAWHFWLYTLLMWHKEESKRRGSGSEAGLAKGGPSIRPVEWSKLKGVPGAVVRPLASTGSINPSEPVTAIRQTHHSHANPLIAQYGILLKKTIYIRKISPFSFYLLFVFFYLCGWGCETAEVAKAV